MNGAYQGDPAAPLTAEAVGLSGVGADPVLDRISEHYAVDRPVVRPDFLTLRDLALVIVRIFIETSD